MELKEGKFIANERGYAFIEVEGEKKDIFIAKNNTKDAMNGDKVIVKILKEKTDGKAKEGKIVKVVSRANKKIVGTFQKSRNFGFVKPDDKKITSDIFISKSKWKNAKNNDKVVVEITKYPNYKERKKAEGRIIEVLGKIDEAGVDMLSIINEFNLENEFKDNVLKEAKKVAKENIEIDLLEKSKKEKIERNNNSTNSLFCKYNMGIQKNNPRIIRYDLRDEEIFTIDGEDAKDLDDACNVVKNEDGSFLLGVHIADVSNYVKSNSLLNKEAILRGTSVYMLDRVIPMLPKELSNGICSLNQKEDRFALSVLMKIDKNGNVIDSDINKTIIRVTKRMNYHEVQRILDDKIEEKDKEDIKYKEHFNNMKELALILKEKRMKNGYLSLDIPETKITLDENGIPIKVEPYKTSFANEIIEQFMLKTNEVVATKFYYLNAPFIYRVHEKPDEDKVKDLNKALFNFGYVIKGKKDDIKPLAFSKILDDVKGKDCEMVIANLILRTLKIAKYEATNRGHFGIASKCYCHFTSPIRRYPDLFIHRVICYYLENNYNIDEKTKEILNTQAVKYAESSSLCEQNATKAERESIKIKMCEFMEKHINEEYTGIISNITNFGMYVRLENTVEGLVRFENMGKEKGEYFIYNEANKTLLGEKSKTLYKLGDKVKIRVIKASKIDKIIDFELLILDNN